MNKIELAKKLQELANRGIDGEKTNAEEMLAKFCKKHNIDMSQLDSEEKSRHEFKRIKEKRYQRLFFQIVGNVIYNWEGNYYERTNGTIAINCTMSECILISSKYEHFVEEYKRTEDDTYRAFIHAARLYSNVSEDKHTHLEDLDKDEQERIRRSNEIAQSLKVKGFQKRLN